METALHTEDLILRPWAEKDIADLVEGLNDVAVAKWLAFVPHPYERSDALKWIGHCQRIATQEGPSHSYEFAVERRADGRIVGGVSLNNIDHQSGSAGGGIWIAAAHQGLGYGRQAFGARIRFAFEVLGLRELHNGYFLGNEPSWSLQERFGYTRVDEPTRPRQCLADGSWKDEVLTRLTREDWAGEGEGTHTGLKSHYR